jgi:exodeoxyribonuclease VII small subunit
MSTDTEGEHTGTGDLGYAEAMAELEAILGDLDDDGMDVDLLSAQVERAAELIRFCRSRILAARVSIETVVAELDELTEPSGDDES